MALSRKSWNYIIMGASIFMIAVLSFINDKTANVPNDTVPLFDPQLPLKQLQLDGIWLSQQDGLWQCHSQVLNCQQWAQSWQNISVSPLTDPPEHSLKEQKLSIAIDNMQTAQLWRYFPNEGLLQSSKQNWYQVPPSLRVELQPILAIPSQSK
ncbi:MAG: hypothetical protein V7771_07925 [Shewanella psychromarinicola]|jgi:hypothetical protein|uniref:hypothetical protein n=1 Tax=Shewanella TaxID=22 RepID=UPI000C32B232|nr:hypothetical protein [Shewanella sp. Actino-trap-3]PKG79227.1 hypothetical protein CXF80_13445 [Shewanella sp. Actino-trap-3]